MDIHIDEVEAICRVFAKVARRVEIRVPGYEDIADAAELTSADEGFESLTIVGLIDDTEVAIGFEFLAGKVQIWTVRDRPDLRGALDEARSVVQASGPPQPWWEIFLSSVVVIVTLMAPTWLLFLALDNHEWIALVLGVPIGLGLASRVTPLYYDTIYRRYKRVANSFREEWPSFWARNKDAILRELIVGVACAVAGSALTIALTR